MLQALRRPGLGFVLAQTGQSLLVPATIVGALVLAAQIVKLVTGI